ELRRQCARRPVPGSIGQGEGFDARPLSRELRRHPGDVHPRPAPPHSVELPRGIGPYDAGRHFEEGAGVEAGASGVGDLFTAETQRRREEKSKMERSKSEGAEGAEVTGATRLSRLNQLTEQSIGAAIEVHRQTGPGLMESVYEECLCYELSQLGLRFQRQVHLPVSYKGVKLDCGFKMDLLVEDAVVLELKTVDQLLPVHSAQLLTYLKLSGKKVGLL